MGAKHVHFGLINVDKESATPVITKPPPTSIPGKNVFLEEYAKSNSPEWTRFENPVVFMEDEVLPEELEEAELEQRAMTEAPAGVVSEELSAHRNSEPALEVPRRHPLSQVINVDDMESPVQSRLQDTAEQGDGGPGAPITFLSDSDDEDGEKFDGAVANVGTGAATITISDDEDDEEDMGDNDEEEELLHHAAEGELGYSSGEDDDEEGPDDTFEFKLRKD